MQVEGGGKRSDMPHMRGKGGVNRCRFRGARPTNKGPVGNGLAPDANGCSHSAIS